MGPPTLTKTTIGWKSVPTRAPDGTKYENSSKAKQLLLEVRVRQRVDLPPSYARLRESRLRRMLLHRTVFTRVVTCEASLTLTLFPKVVKARLDVAGERSPPRRVEKTLSGPDGRFSPLPLCPASHPISLSRRVPPRPLTT